SRGLLSVIHPELPDATSDRPAVTAFLSGFFFSIRPTVSTSASRTGGERLGGNGLEVSLTGDVEPRDAEKDTGRGRLAATRRVARSARHGRAGSGSPSGPLPGFGVLGRAGVAGASGAYGGKFGRFGKNDPSPYPVPRWLGAVSELPGGRTIRSVSS